MGGGIWKILVSSDDGVDTVYYIDKDYPIKRNESDLLVSAEGLRSPRMDKYNTLEYDLEVDSLVYIEEYCEILGILSYQDGGWQIQLVMKGNTELRTDTFYLIKEIPEDEYWNVVVNKYVGKQARFWAEGVRSLHVEPGQPDVGVVYDLSLLTWAHYGEAKELDEAYASCQCDGFVLPVAVLQDEPAYVRNKYDNFFIELKNKSITSEPLYPIRAHGDSIPGEFQKDGLPVSISGLVWGCSEQSRYGRTDPCQYLRITEIKKL